MKTLPFMLCTFFFCFHLQGQADYRADILKIIDSLQSVTQESGSLSELSRKQGWEFFYNNQIEKAHHLFHYSIQNSSENVKNLDAYAQTSALLNNLDESEQLYRKILVLDSNYIDAYGSIFKLLICQNRILDAKKYVENLLNIDAPEIRREAYSIAAVLSVHNAQWNNAIGYLKKRLKVTKEIWNIEASVLDHPYWDMHLIGNILLNIGKPDEALLWYEKGLQFAENTLKEGGRPLRIIKSDFDFFYTFFLLKKEQWENATKKMRTGFDKNPNGFGLLWSRILIGQNKPEKAMEMLNKYCRDGYYKQFLKGKIFLLNDEIEIANKFFTEVKNHCQVGNRYWLHEHALIVAEIKQELLK